MARQGYGSGRRGQGSGRGYGDDQDRWGPESQVGRDYDDRSGPSGAGYGSGDYGENRRRYGGRSRRDDYDERGGSFPRSRSDQSGYDSDQDRDDVVYTGRRSYADVSEDRDANRRSGRYNDDHYHELRERHMEQFDRDYDEYRRARRERIGQDFDEWRRERGSSDDGQSSGDSSGSTSSGARSGSTTTSGKTDKS